ncbi:MAG: insulinase family protein, partial [Chitinophagales bacterium]
MITTQKNRIDRTLAPEIVDAVDFNLQLKSCRKFLLQNGVEVYAIDAGAEEVMMVELVYYAGDWYEEKNLVAAATNFMLKNGTSAKTAFQINEHFEY